MALEFVTRLGADLQDESCPPEIKRGVVGVDHHQGNIDAPLSRHRAVGTLTGNERHHLRLEQGIQLVFGDLLR